VDLNEIKEAIRGLAPEGRRELLAWMADEERAAPSAQAKPDRVPVLPGLTRAVAGTLIGLIGFALVEGAIFHSGWYSKYLEPNSRAGQVEYSLFWLQRMRRPPAPDILVMGDSRIAEGFSSRTANAAFGGKVHFTNLAVSGSIARIWYYMLRDGDKTRDRFSAIVIPFDNYSDIERGAVNQDRDLDLGYLAGRLRWSDCWDYSRSYLMAELRRSVLTECTIRGLVLRPDVLDFLSNIPQRLKRAKDWRNNGEIYEYAYTGRPEALTGLTFDAATRTIHFPPGAKDWQIPSVRATLNPYIVPQTGSITVYRRRWIGGILDLYKNSATRFIFIQMPNAPVPLPEPAEPAAFIDSVKGRARLTVLPEDMFRHLQRPEWFADGLHLNSTGRELFSVELAKAVAPIVEGR
jgi:hypothetical protein